MATAAAARPALKSKVQTGDIVARVLTFMFACSLVLLAALLVIELFRGSQPARERLGWGFLTSSLWNPVTDQFGALPFIYGTVITSLVAMLISIPMGVGAAIFLAELAPAG